MNEKEMITGIEVPISFKYNYTAGSTAARFLMKMKEGKIVGQRCPSCSNVYMPPRGCCAKCGVVTEEEVELPSTGVIQSFTIVHLPIPGSPIEPPIISANIVLDGADISFLHLISEVDLEKVEIGMRVEAVWKPEEEWEYSFENIAWFRPIEKTND
jgi:uncharacterized OB-fold protein